MKRTAAVRKAKAKVANDRLNSTLTSTSTWIELVPARPGHDFRYALDNTEIERELGWCPAIGFDEGLRRTAAWYREHADWWRPLKARLTRETVGFWTEAVHSPKTRVPCSPNQGL
jgi:dTDP-D-glucose 4,6-dehydratase